MLDRNNKRKLRLYTSIKNLFETKPIRMKEGVRNVTRKGVCDVVAYVAKGVGGHVLLSSGTESFKTEFL